MRLVILGGGGFRVPIVLRALAARPELGIDEVVLHDIDPARLAVISSSLPDLRIRVRLEEDLHRALAGADVAFSAIRVGGASGRMRDERRALDLGVLGQETVGAGGLAYGLRTLPVVLEAARIQAEVAPEAWLINFTNPAGMLTQALAPVLGRKVLGICDSPVGLIRRVCRALGTRESDVQADYAGINHLGWLRSLHRSGVDLLPGLLSDRAALQTIEEGRLFGPGLLKVLAGLPNEYVYFYYFAKEISAELSSGRTRGEVLFDEQEAFFARAAAEPRRAAELWEATRQHRERTYLAETRTGQEQRDDADLTGGGYQDVALDLIGALTGSAAIELIVNAPNGSALSQLPADTVIETRCRVDESGATPLPAPDFDLHQLGLVAGVRASENAVISAVVTGSRAEALRAFALHPLIGSWDIAGRLLDGVLTDHPQLADLLR